MSKLKTYCVTSLVPMSRYISPYVTPKKDLTKLSNLYNLFFLYFSQKQAQFVNFFEKNNGKNKKKCFFRIIPAIFHEIFNILL